MSNSEFYGFTRASVNATEKQHPNDEPDLKETLQQMRLKIQELVHRQEELETQFMELDKQVSRHIAGLN